MERLLSRAAARTEKPGVSLGSSYTDIANGVEIIYEYNGVIRIMFSDDK